MSIFLQRRTICELNNPSVIKKFNDLNKSLFRQLKRFLASDQNGSQEILRWKRAKIRFASRSASFSCEAHEEQRTTKKRASSSPRNDRSIPHCAFRRCSYFLFFSCSFSCNTERSVIVTADRSSGI